MAVRQPSWQPIAPVVGSAAATVVHGFEVPAELSELAEEIERSRSILELEDDWDEFGSPSYDEHSWRRAVGLLVRVATETWLSHGLRIDSVDIVPAASGAIGLELRTPGHEFVITVPADPEREALFYGDDGHGGEKHKGTLVPEKPNRWLATWLAE